MGGECRGVWHGPEYWERPRAAKPRCGKRVRPLPITDRDGARFAFDGERCGVASRSVSTDRCRINGVLTMAEAVAPTAPPGLRSDAIGLREVLFQSVTDM